jgi:glucose-1-phosphate cytidylyltransferase
MVADRASAGQWWHRRAVGSARSSRATPGHALEFPTMKVVILAGGLGSRLAEETDVKPKPMVEIGGRPILWHIMKHYAHHGFDEFVVALGYRGDVVKRYFLDYHALSGGLTVDLKDGSCRTHGGHSEPWTIHLMDTGHDTLTGGRVKRLQSFLGDATFMVTYGDGVSDVDLRDLLSFHRGHGKLATLTAVRPPARFGGIVFRGDMVAEFTEKPQIGEGWINGGYLVLEPGIFAYLGHDRVSLEADTMERLAADGQLAAYRHQGFWQCMDTVRDLRLLESLWRDGNAPWKLWT